MTEEQQRNEEQSEHESLISKPTNWFWGADWACEFLMKTHPAQILVLGAVAIILAGLMTYLGAQSMSNSFGSQGTATLYEGGAHLSFGFFALPAFLFGILGTLLPTWAVGRLIADAIRDGAKS